MTPSDNSRLVSLGIVAVTLLGWLNSRHLDAARQENQRLRAEINAASSLDSPSATAPTSGTKTSQRSKEAATPPCDPHAVAAAVSTSASGAMGSEAGDW